MKRTKGWFFERESKIDKHRARLTEKRRKKKKIRNERGEIATDTAEIEKKKKPNNSKP